MSEYLLAISIGPVQEFIAAGRRTADLYAGSDLIKQISTEVAQSVAKSGTLIFPADKEQGGANKILAMVAADPKAVAENAKSVAQHQLEEAWNQAYNALSEKQRGVIAHEIAKQQLANFLEFYAAWTPLDGSYKDCRKRVEALLAGRKALRDFVQPQKHPGRPKSLLDPSRDSVINGKPQEVAADRPLQLKPSEYLDAVSLLKRIRGADKMKAVASTTDMAGKTVLANHPELAQHSELGEALRNHPDWIYASRRRELVDEGTMSPEKAEAIAKVTRGKEDPYFAILVADGDKIGKHISEHLATQEEHMAFSNSLAKFETKAEQIVIRHDGHPVYCGGDDVLAFLPLHEALACAAALARKFRDTTGCTLSAGVAIVHHLEPLHITLDYARAAEKQAKKKRNALHLAVHTRGGEARGATIEWGAQPGPEALQDWRRWVAAFKGGLSGGFPYELERLAREANGVDLPPDALQTALRNEVLRIYERKKKAEDATEGGGVQDIRNALEGVRTPQDLHNLAQCLIVLRWLSNYPMQWEVKS